MDADEKATKDEPLAGEIARRYLEYMLAVDETSAKDTRSDGCMEPERETFHDPLLGEMLGAKLKLIVTGTQIKKSQRILAEMSRYGEYGCDGVGLLRDPDDHRRITVMVLMRDGWYQVGTLAPRNARAISQAIDKGASKVQVTDWKVFGGHADKPYQLRIHVSIS